MGCCNAGSTKDELILDETSERYEKEYNFSFADASNDYWKNEFPGKIMDTEDLFNFKQRERSISIIRTSKSIEKSVSDNSFQDFIQEIDRSIKNVNNCKSLADTATSLSSSRNAFKDII